MKLITPLLLILSLNCFSQNVGRIRQGTTCIVWYDVLPNDSFHLFIRNAHTEPSVMQVTFNDSVFTKVLGRWEKYQWNVYAPKGFSLYARNLSYPGTPEFWECGSKRQVDKVKTSRVTKPLIIKYQCDLDVSGFPVRDNTVRQ